MSQQEFDKIKSQIQQHLVSSGKFDIINKQLKLLLYECGWFDKVNQLASRELQELKEKDNSTNFESLYSSIRPQADELVPQEVRDDTIDKLKSYLDEVIQ